MAQLTSIIIANIGAGKSALLNTFKKKREKSPLLDSTSIVKELRVEEEDPKVLEIVENKFIPALKEGDENKLFFAEMDILKARFDQYHRIMRENGIWFLERSIYEDRFVFVEYLAQKGYLSPDHFEDYTAVFEHRLKSIIPPNIIIYLYTDPAVAFERIKKRGREYEKNYTLEYITELHNYYEKMVRKELPAIIKNFDERFLPPINVNENFDAKDLEGFHNNIELELERQLRIRGFL
jgi:deoxyadenosine/deoxycytidine kinase